MNELTLSFLVESERMMAFRFHMMIARSDRGERGWQLAEVVAGVPHFRMWSVSSAAVRKQAFKLGATAETLCIEGVRSDLYRMPEDAYRLSRTERRDLGYA